ncbi:MAG TPA: CPXCG motif-containing cysteine-rich protein [Vicinamibacterales bacterium]|nr:CPXCG motif-containing cysteine-rich protein [Vicinamibacterales bacterium]
MDVVARCPYCGEPIELYVDEGGGVAQHYIEDCSVCCRPIEIRITLGPGDDERDQVTVSVRTTDE